MAIEFQRILLPVDFTPKNQSAVEVTIDLAKQYDATVSLLHVIETIDLPEDDELRRFYQQLQQRAEIEMDLLATQFDDDQNLVDREILFGKRAEEIVRFAEQQAIDLIVMTSHAVDTQKPIKSWSTISYQVSLVCGCPILLVK